MRREFIVSIRAAIALTILVGLLYPFAVWAIGQVAFHGRANGSQIHVDGKVVGSRLIGQDFSEPVIGTNGKPRVRSDGSEITQPNPRYFQERPSQDSYNASATFFSNRGPNDSAAVDFYKDQLAAYLALEGPYNPGLTAKQVPIDAVTTSASGVDPDISLANARIQAHRVAAARHLPLDTVNTLIDQHTDSRTFGVFGEPGVNVVELNIALDKVSS